MEIKILFTIIGSIIGLGFTFPYIREILRGKTKPHMYTWVIWSVTQATAGVAALNAGGKWGAYFLFLCAIVNFFIFILSLKFGTRNITKLDTFMLLLALLGVFILWQTQEPFIAVVLVSATDLIAYFPSFRKTYRDPATEPYIYWLAFTVATLFAIAALSEYNFITLTYLLTITAGNLTMTLICLFRRNVV